MPEELDLIVIGAGSAARDGAMKAQRQYGARVAMVERTRWGGSCPNVACKPTKAYLVVADLLHDINHLAGKLGIEVGPARADLARIKARKDTLLKPQEQWIADLEAAGIETFPGEAALVDAHTVRVGETELRADAHPDRDRLADGDPADRGHRGRRLGRPHQRARADRAARNRCSLSAAARSGSSSGRRSRGSARG